MRTLNINNFIKKVNNYKNSGVHGDIKIPMEEAIGVVLELSMIITENHLISYEDLKEALLNSKFSSTENKKITGGTF